jgi:protein-disulfide isomerase
MVRFGSRNQRFVVVAAAVVAVALIGASQISVRGEAGTGEAARAAVADGERASSRSPFVGIPQRGAALGSAAAPVTLVEYADLQCPYCAQWARETLPVLVDEYVREGKLRIVFKGLAFIGPDSEKALRTAIAAGRRDHLWELVHGLYARQEAENTGWVSDALVRELAADSGLDGDKLLEERSAADVESELERAAASARAAGVHGTPSFEIGPTAGQLKTLPLGSLGPDGIVPAIEAELAR